MRAGFVERVIGYLGVGLTIISVEQGEIAFALATAICAALWLRWAVLAQRKSR